MLTEPINTALQGFLFHQLLMVVCAFWAGLFLGVFLTVAWLVVVDDRRKLLRG